MIGNKRFMMTYGDGLSDINIEKLLKFHEEKGRLATVTGVRKQNQYGILKTDNGIATYFEEKKDYSGVINGGFFVFELGIFDYLSEWNDCALEKEPLKNLVRDRELAVYMHEGFWYAADTHNDIDELNRMCEENMDLWRVW